MALLHSLKKKNLTCFQLHCQSLFTLLFVFKKTNQIWYGYVAKTCGKRCYTGRAALFTVLRGISLTKNSMETCSQQFQKQLLDYASSSVVLLAYLALRCWNKLLLLSHQVTMAEQQIPQNTWQCSFFENQNNSNQLTCFTTWSRVPQNLESAVVQFWSGFGRTSSPTSFDLEHCLLSWMCGDWECAQRFQIAVTVCGSLFKDVYLSMSCSI